MIRALIFDFDGLILETEMPDYLAWREIYQEYGAELPVHQWVGIIGARMSETGFDPVRALEAQVGHSLDGDALRSRHDARDLALSLEQPVMPGVEALVADARRRGLKLGIASSSRAGWVSGHLERLGLSHHFDVVKTIDDVERAKPDPALYRSALEALQVAASEAIVLEDSLNGVVAAKRAGIYVVAVPTELTRHLDLSTANMQLRSLADITLDELIAQVGGHQ